MSVLSPTSAITALDIIKRALRLLGVYATGEEPDASETADALKVLNALMGSLSNTPLVFAKTRDVIALTAGVSSITVGPSGSTVTDRPMRVLDESYIQSGSTTYPLRVFTDQQYSDVGVKDTQGYPEAIWPLMGMPDVTLTFFPVPTGGLTLYLWSVKQLEGFPALTSEASLPPGYVDLLGLELAKAIAPEYQKALPVQAEERRRALRRDLAVMNLEVPMLAHRNDFACGHFNVLTNR
jgi:hypothetical protein